MAGDETHGTPAQCAIGMISCVTLSVQRSRANARSRARTAHSLEGEPERDFDIEWAVRRVCRRWWKRLRPLDDRNRFAIEIGITRCLQDATRNDTPLPIDQEGH